MSANDITTLRGHLFDTLEALRDKTNPMDIDRAKAIGDIAQTIINTAKAEVEYLRVTGGQGSGFIGAEPPAPGLPQQTATGTGTKHVTKIPGGTVTQHRIR